VGKAVAITGMGVASAAGCDVASFWNRVRSGHSACRATIKTETNTPAAAFEAAVDDAEFDKAAELWGVRKSERVVKLARVACHQAWADAGLPNPALPPLGARAGIILGSGLGGILFQEEQMWRVLKSADNRIHPHTVPRVSPTALITEVAQTFALRGPGFVVSSACASSAHAIGQAFRTIQNGDADVILAGGAETPLSPFSMTAFSLLGVLAKSGSDPKKACRPFDESRDGFVLGEGAGALLLESVDHARARGAHIYAFVHGYGQTLGAYHAVHARPDGEDAADAMFAALRDAGVSPQQVGYVNAHGTATRENDLAESRAMRLVFGEGTLKVPVSSIKPVTGHTLGAAGVLEAVATVKAIQEGVLPPNANLSAMDPQCDLYVPSQPTPCDLRFALSNSFGFGNVNVSLLFGKE
jgi:3-oxoacyl-[acyl-carrier-protein] synthase II